MAFVKYLFIQLICELSYSFHLLLEKFHGIKKLRYLFDLTFFKNFI